MGGMQALSLRRQLSRPRRARCWRSPPPRGIRRRTSPSTRSAARRSWPIRTGAAATITAAASAPDEGPRGGADGGAHHLSLRGRADRQVRPPAAGRARPRASASTPISRSRATCATRGSASPTGSTPTAISTSPGRWTISTSPRSMAGGSPMPSRAPTARFCAGQLRHRLALSDRRIARDRPRAQRRRRAPVSFVELSAPFGHDSFLLDVPALDRVVRGLPRMAELPTGYELTDDPARIDVDAVHAYLARSYWSPGIPLRHGRAGDRQLACASRRLSRRRAGRLRARRSPTARPSPISPTSTCSRSHRGHGLAQRDGRAGSSTIPSCRACAAGC